MSASATSLGMRWSALGLVALLLAAGCVQPKDHGAPPTAESPPGSVLAQEQPVALPAERAAVTSIQVHQSYTKGTTAPPKEPGFDISGCDDPGERDFTVAFAGTHRVFDEFARPEPAHVFDTSERVCVTTDVSFTGSGFHVTGHFEDRPLEETFDRADAREISLSDLKAGYTVFNDPANPRHPFGGSFSLAFALPHWLQGDYTRQRLVQNFTYQRQQEHVYEWLQRSNATHPVDGDCVMWEFHGRVDPPLPSGPADAPVANATKKVDPDAIYHSYLCIPPGTDVPLWLWSGSKKSGSVTDLRTSDPFALPEFAGDYQRPVKLDKMPWVDVDSGLPVPLPGIGPTKMPPAVGPLDWASRMAKHLQVLYTSPAYLKYRQASKEPYPWIINDEPTSLAPGGGNITVLGQTIGLPPQLHDPIFDRVTQFSLTDGANMHGQDVNTRTGSAEQGDISVADPDSYDFPLSFFNETADQLLPLVPDSTARNQLAPLLPNQPDYLSFDHLSFFDNDVGWLRFADWQSMRLCTDKADGQMGTFDAYDGHMELLAVLHHRSNGSCQVGDPEGPCAQMPTILPQRTADKVKQCLHASLLPRLPQAR